MEFLRDLFFKSNETYEVSFKETKNFTKFFVIIFIFSVIFYMIGSFFGWLGRWGLIISVPYMLYQSVKYVAYSSFDDVKLKIDLQQQLKVFCYSNNFVNEHYQPLVLFSINYMYLFVVFRLDGSGISKKYRDLKQQLQDLIVLDFERLDEGDGYVSYVFRRLPLERKMVSDVVTDGDVNVTGGGSPVAVVSFEKENKRKDNVIVINDLHKWNCRKNPHALLVGGTGSGKTFFLSYLILSILRFGADLLLFDPKRSDISYLKRFLDSVEYEKGGILRRLREFQEGMNSRYDEMLDNPNYGFGKDYFDYGYNASFLVFDEYSAFVSTLKKSEKEEVEGRLEEIVMKGRQAGFFIIFSMQKASSESIKTSIRDLLGFRVALGECTTSSYKMIFDEMGKDLNLTSSVKGAGYLYLDGVMKVPVDFVSPYMDVDFVEEFKKYFSEYEKREKDLKNVN